MTQVFKPGDTVRVTDPNSTRGLVYGTLHKVAYLDAGFLHLEGSRVGEGWFESRFELVNPATDQSTKDTNPKDAIGDKKVPLWLLSPIAKAQWAVCQFVGMVKYGAWNWREAGVRSSIYMSAMQRHLDAYMSGEEVDPIDQTPHLGHIMACAAILIDAKAAGKLTDDRPPSVGVREAYAQVEQQMELARKNYGDKNPKHYTIADTKQVTAE